MHSARSMPQGIEPQQGSNPEGERGSKGPLSQLTIDRTQGRLRMNRGVPNDICDRCLKAAVVPARAMRCEWGCCFWDAEAVEAAIAAAAAINTRALSASVAAALCLPTHECEACSFETHRLTAIELLDAARKGVPYLPARRIRVVARDGQVSYVTPSRFVEPITMTITGQGSIRTIKTRLRDE